MLRMLDDHFLVAPTAEGCAAMLQTSLDILSHLGVQVAAHKTVLPAQRVKFLGYWWYTDVQRVSLDLARWHALGAQVGGMLQAALQDDWVSVQDLRVLLGLLVWASRVVDLGRLQLCALYRVLFRSGGNSARTRVASTIPVRMTPEALEELGWWAALAQRAVLAGETGTAPGRSFAALMGPHPPTVICHTDASALALGAWWSPADQADAPVSAEWLQFFVPPEFQV